MTPRQVTKFVLAYVVTVGYAIVMFLFGFQPGVVLQLWLMLLFPALVCYFLFAVVSLVRRWKRREISPALLAPLAIGLFGLVFAGRLGHDQRERYFLSVLPQCQKVVDAVRKKQPYDLSFWRGSGIRVDEDQPGKVAILFLWGGGFPVKHDVLVYLEDAEEWKTGQFRRSWPSGYKLVDHWYVVWD